MAFLLAVELLPLIVEYGAVFLDVGVPVIEAAIEYGGTAIELIHGIDTANDIYKKIFKKDLKPASLGKRLMPTMTYKGPTTLQDVHSETRKQSKRAHIGDPTNAPIAPPEGTNIRGHHPTTADPNGHPAIELHTMWGNPLAGRSGAFGKTI